jgi:hypothetical protein
MCAMHWGNGDFESIRPEGSLVTATFLHDIGWQEFDQRPRLKTDEKTGNPTPVNFHELSPQTWVEMYEQGIETVARIDPYAGLVVSLHGVGLQNRRYGLTPEWSEPTSEFDGFIQREQKRQRQLIEQISDQDDLSISAEERTTLERVQEDNYNPEQYEGQLWCNYKLLQIWDTLSHILCATTNPTGETSIENVPVSASVDITVSIHSETANTYRIDPYPFQTDPLVVSVTERTVSEQTLKSGDTSAIAREYFLNTDEIEFRIHS